MLENEAGDFEKFWSASKFGKASIGRFWISPIEGSGNFGKSSIERFWEKLYRGFLGFWICLDVRGVDLGDGWIFETESQKNN